MAKEQSVDSQVLQAAQSLGRALFHEEIPDPGDSNQRPYTLDDTGVFVIVSGSQALNSFWQRDVFSRSPLASTYELAYKGRTHDNVANVLRKIKGDRMELFPAGFEQEQIALLHQEYARESRVNPIDRHTFMLRNANVFVRGAYLYRFMEGVEQVGNEDIQPIGDYVELRKRMMLLDDQIDRKRPETYDEAMMDAAMTVYAYQPVTNFQEASQFIGAGIVDGGRVTVATIDALHTAVPEWNATHPDNQLDLYQFAATEGKKWVTRMATSHKDPFFTIMRNLCGDTYMTDSPRFHPQAVGIGTQNGAPKIGFRLDTLDENSTALLPTLNASHFGAVPRATCPALGIFTESLYTDMLDFYQKSMQ